MLMAYDDCLCFFEIAVFRDFVAVAEINIPHDIVIHNLKVFFLSNRPESLVMVSPYQHQLCFLSKEVYKLKRISPLCPGNPSELVLQGSVYDYFPGPAYLHKFLYPFHKVLMLEPRKHDPLLVKRSEERRVGKECRSR